MTKIIITHYEYYNCGTSDNMHYVTKCVLQQNTMAVITSKYKGYKVGTPAVKLKH